LEKPKQFKLSGNWALEKQEATCRWQLLAASWQSEDVDQVGRGLEHQLPHLYSQGAGIVVVQRAAEEVVVVDEVVVVVDEVVVDEVVVDEVVVVVDEVVVEVEDVVLDTVVEDEDGDDELKLQG
jgi:hypothetical protein